MDLNIKDKTFRKNIGENLEDLWLGKHSLTSHQKHDHKRKNLYIGLQKNF